MPIVISDATGDGDTVRVHNTDTNTHEDVPRTSDAIRAAYERAGSTSNDDE